MTALTEPAARTDLLNRLRRAEGQLRRVQRMIEVGSDCRSIAGQLNAVRKALDSTYSRMVVCFVEQELGTSTGARAHASAPATDGRRDAGIARTAVQAGLNRPG